MSHKILHKILRYGDYQQVKSIHIKFNKDDTDVRYEKTHDNPEDLVIAKESQDTILNEIKEILKTEEEIIEHRYCKIKDKNWHLSFNISIINTGEGKKIIIDLVKKSSTVLKINKLGLESKQLKNLLSTIKNESGLIIIAGYYNSGKSTLFYSLLNEINDPNKNIVSIEKVREQNIVGVSQILIDKNTGFKYNNAIDNALKQNSEVIAIDELNKDNVNNIFRAASATKLVLTSLNSSDSISVIERLQTMGISPSKIAENVKLIITPRILDLNCPHCAKKYEISEEGKMDIKHIMGKRILNKMPSVIYKSKGCARCNYSRHQGCTGVFEFFNISPAIKQAILGKATYEEIEKIAKAEGFSSLEDNTIIKIKNGLISIDEVIKKSPKGDIKL